MFEIHKKFMSEAIKEARIAYDNGDVPIGAVVAFDGVIIGRGYNMVEEKGDPMAHAEIFAINSAIKHLQYKHLFDCSLYVTLEPCAMCSGAIILARIPTLVFGADDPKAGASGSLFNITNDKRLNHRCEIIAGVMKVECSEMLRDFFHSLRYNDKNCLFCLNQDEKTNE